MHHWKRNVTFIWMSQFLSIMGFSFGVPFAPYFMQELGVNDPIRLKMWIALFGAVTPLAMAFFAPVWGILADRHGRRLMLLRANFAASIILLLMGMVTSPLQLVLLRLMQGAFTGTMTAAQVMVAVNAPSNRSGVALGTLSAAVYSGSMTGMFLGGIFANLFGYRNAFFVSGFLLLLGGCLVIFGTVEKADGHDGDAEIKQHKIKGRSLSQLKIALPILLLVAVMTFVRQFDSSFLSLLVQEIHGKLQGVSLWTGTIGAISGAAGLCSGILLGRLADRVSPSKIAMSSALGASGFMIVQGLARGFGLLFPARFGMVFCAGGLDPMCQIWLAKTTPEKQRGMIFGWAGTAKAIGLMAAPLLSGVVACSMGIRAIYFTGSILFFLLIFMIKATMGRKGSGVNGAK